ncbi:dehydrogenase/reductase SDR family member 7 [Oratosquilla oratoria]|uniref:dehydrogenase/reductase SDR family member 7 n=1 Tax=Oratosquilla oratoria TaxID=337810 RepID=UPI003F775B67
MGNNMEQLVIGGVVVGLSIIWLLSLPIINFIIMGAILAFLRYFVYPLDCDLTLLFMKTFGKSPEILKGKVVWVTGASSGIGEEIAVTLAKYGARVALSARSVENLERVKNRCIEGGSKEEDILVLPMDILCYDKHETCFDAVIQHFGKLDILVSNAGRSQRARWEHINIDVDRELFELNTFSLVALSRIVTRYFLLKGEGHLVVTSSTVGKMAVPGSASYTASKHALHGYFETLRLEKAGHNIAVTMLCPGPVASNLLKECFVEVKGEKLGKEREGKNMSAERCAELSVVAIANQLCEVWIARQPVLIFYYVMQYFPTMLRWAIGLLSVNTIMKMRDGRVDIIDYDDSSKEVKIGFELCPKEEKDLDPKEEETCSEECTKEEKLES